MQENQSREPQTVLQHLEAIKKRQEQQLDLLSKQVKLLTDIRDAAVFFHILGIIGLVAGIIYAIIITR